MSQLAKRDEDEFIESSLPGFAEVDSEEVTSAGWEMKKLKPKHLQICALLAQGMKNVEVAAIVGVTPEYVSMLLRQELIKQEIMRISSIAAVRLEAMFEKSVDVLGEVLSNGNNQEKLKAIRVHGELTKRIGRPDPLANTGQVSDDRLVVLAERLASLARGAREGYDPKEIIEAEFTVRSSEGGQEA